MKFTPQTATDSSQHNALLEARLERLRGSLNRYSICDRHGVFAGQPHDLKSLQDDSLCLLVRSSRNKDGDRRYNIPAREVERVDSHRNAIVLKLSLQEMERYRTAAPAAESTESTENTENGNGAIADIDLLEERLNVDRGKRKLADVVVRKEVETEIIEVPVRREKLLVERVAPNPETLAEIDLKEEDTDGQTAQKAPAIPDREGDRTMVEFSSIERAVRSLHALSQRVGDRNFRVRVEVFREPQRSEGEDNRDETNGR